MNTDSSPFEELHHKDQQDQYHYSKHKADELPGIIGGEIVDVYVRHDIDQQREYQKHHGKECKHLLHGHRLLSFFAMNAAKRIIPTMTPTFKRSCWYRGGE